MPNKARRVRVALMPSAIACKVRLLKTTGQGLFPYPSDLPVLVDPSGHVVLGTSRVRSARQSVPAVTVNPPDAQRHALTEFDAASDSQPSTRARAAAALRDIGIPLFWVQKLLRCSDPGTASRWARLTQLPASVLAAMDRGSVTLGHARVFFDAPSDRIDHLVGECDRYHWSVARLKAALTGTSPTSALQPASADIEAFSGALSQALGASVRILWPDRPDDRRLQITWYDVEGLKGILGHLARGPLAEGTMPTRARVLTFALVDASELDALTGHLAT